MLLHVPALARTVVLLHQRWLTSSLTFQTDLHLALTKNNSSTQINQVNALQMVLRNLTAFANRERRINGPAATTNSSEFRLVTTSEKSFRRVVIDEERRHKHALALAIDRTSRDMSTEVHQKYLVHRERQLNEVSTLLTQRVRRIAEPSVKDSPRAFRVSPPNQPRVTQIIEESVSPTQRASHVVSRHFQESVPANLNVEMLADQVLKQIDRRVVARRERMGQI
jgi:hypothetical protein